MLLLIFVLLIMQTINTNKMEAIKKYLDNLENINEFEFWGNELSCNLPDCQLVIPFKMTEFDEFVDIIDEHFPLLSHEYFANMKTPDMQDMLKRYFQINLSYAKIENNEN